MTTHRSILVALLGLLLTPTLLPAQTRPAPRLRRVALTDRLQVLALAGGNMALYTGPTASLLVDADVPPLGQRVYAEVGKLAGKPIRYLVNTHWHFDHVGANEAFGKAGTLIVAHRNVRAKVSRDRVIKTLGRKVPALPKAAWPTLTYSTDLTLHLDGEEIVLTHMPGAHTDGDTVVHFKQANVIHAGDLVFNPGYPFIEVQGGGSVKGVIAALARIGKMGDEKTRIIPGHGPLMNKAELARYRENLVAFRRIIAREIAAGKSLQTIQAARPTAALDARVKPRMFSPARFTRLVYLSLTRGRNSTRPPAKSKKTR